MDGRKQPGFSSKVSKMVTTEEVERYYAEKLGIDSDSDYSSFPSSVLHQLQYFTN